jgi:hypothetical protein
MGLHGVYSWAKSGWLLDKSRPYIYKLHGSRLPRINSGVRSPPLTHADVGQIVVAGVSIGLARSARPAGPL